MKVDVGAGLAKLENEAVRLTKDVALPTAKELAEVSEKVVEFATGRVEEEKAAAAREGASAERISMILGAAVALLLIGACVLSIVTIAKPISALTKSMLELAEGNFSVVLPGLGRKDEVGAVAAAVERFKVASEQKAREEAEAKRNQDEIATQQRKADMIKLADSFEVCHRRDRRNSRVRLDRTGSLGQYADFRSRAGPAPDNDGCGCFRGSIDQRSFSCRRNRRVGIVRHRDRPSGAGISAHCE